MAQKKSLARVALLCGCMAAATPVAAQDPAAGPTVTVSGFRVNGNTLLSPAQLDAALAPFVGRRSFADLERAAAAVQALYAQAGYGAVVAFLPPQAATDGEVEISVVEGRIASISVRGAQRYSEAQLRASLPALQVGQTPAMKRIDAQLQMANENPAKQTQVLLQPGARRGEVEAQITVEERPLQRWTLGLDNTGNERTGELRANLGWQHANIGGRDDVLSAQFQTSPDKPDRVKVLSVGYRQPLYAHLLVLDAHAAFSDVDGGSTATAAGDLRFNGRGRLFGLRASWILPRWGSADQRLVVGLDQRTYLNDCAISGLPAGACGSAGESVALQPLALEYALQAAGAVAWGLNLALASNLQLGGDHAGAADFNDVRAGARPRYTAWRASGFASTAVFEDWQLKLRFAGQWSGDALVPGEQFGIGGAASVRGYAERELVGDRGGLVTVELGTPPLGGEAGPALRLSAFADAGAVHNLLDTPCQAGRTRCTLAAVGVGALVGAGSTQLRVQLAQALRVGAATSKHAVRAHVALRHSF